MTMITSASAARTLLTARSKIRHGGMRIGAVVVLADKLQPLRVLIEDSICRVARATRVRRAFRGVDPLPSSSEYHDIEVSKGQFLVAHLSPEAAWVMEEVCGKNSGIVGASSELVHFIQVQGVEYYSGVRPKVSIWDRAPLLKSAQQTDGTHYHFSFAEVFAGIGGFRLSLEPLGGRCVLASEIDTMAIDTYRANFLSLPSLPFSNATQNSRRTGLHRLDSVTDIGDELVGDISEYYTEDLPHFDILTAGFPCQPFSQRGDQPGLTDGKGQLYLELVRLLMAKQPKAFLFENVVGLVVMDGGKRPGRFDSTASRDFVAGRTFESIIKSFADTGYDVSWHVVNSQHWLPQSRERVFIVGLRSNLQHSPMNWDAILPATPSLNSPSVDSSNESMKLKEVITGEASIVRNILEDPKSEMIKACELSEEQWSSVVGRVRRSLEISGENSSEDLESTVRNFKEIVLDQKAPTIISSYATPSSHSSKFIFEESDGTIRDGETGNKRPRFLTPRECARCMGFPDSFLIPDEAGDQGRNFYRQIGNAVCPPVARVPLRSKSSNLSHVNRV